MLNETFKKPSELRVATKYVPINEICAYLAYVYERETYKLLIIRSFRSQEHKIVYNAA